MNVWWLLVVTFFSLLLVSAADHDYENCLGMPEVAPKKYFHIQSKSLTITLETSNRVTHRLITEVFYIFLKEVLGYDKVEIKVRDDNFEIEPVIERLTQYSPKEKSEPPATINMEVWIRPDYDSYVTQLVEECGSIAPPGRFGWFIPRDLDKPVRGYYAEHNWTGPIQEVHWTMFVDPVIVQLFDIPSDLVDTLLDRNSRVLGPGSAYVCSNTNCHKSMYTPPQCEDKACAILLAPAYNVSSFLIQQIQEMGLLVKVLFLGDNLQKVVKELDDIYSLANSTRSIVFFYWYPSEIVINQKEYISVVFTNNEIMNFTRDFRIGYKYEMHRLVKLAWSKIEKNAQPLYESLKNFKVTEEDYAFMLRVYNEYSGNTVREVACQWMLQKKMMWNWWKMTSPTVIYIGGIFPVGASSYNGAGIVMGAFMATNAINSNRTILSNYDLKLLVQDGQCKPDNVMKAFIDFIVEGYYPQLVGVLGPACSDTVEPLAGVSRHYHIMVISYSAEGAIFSDRKKYPYFFRTIGENKHYMNVYLNLFKYFGWKRVAALTEDGQKYTEYISLMQDDLEKNDIKFIANKKFPRERETEAMTRYLEDLKNKRARIIIADVVDNVARAVMCEAYKLNMTAAQGYVWFLPMWLNATWYDTDHFNVNKTNVVNCTTKEMKKAISGYFAMTHAYFAPDDAIMQEGITVKQWRDRYKQHTKTPSNYAGFAYDAVWTYALALDKLGKIDPEALADLHSENTTNKLVKLVEETDFYGVSGRIKFRGGPSRFSIINIMQWYNGSIHNIGHFYPNLSDNRPEVIGGELSINKSAVRWFTPNGNVPGDGTLEPPICGVKSVADLFNITCESAYTLVHVSVAMAVIIVVVAVCYFIIKRKYDKKMQQAASLVRALGFAFDMNNTISLDKWELSRENVVINRKLGEGAFGTVYGGEANLPNEGWKPVAVKTLKIGSTTEEKLDFLSEAEVMKKFQHKNIVQLKAVCTREEPIFTIMEFMLYGDLKTYLLARRHLVNHDPDEEVSSKRLTNMALDVARALSYLASLKYVHRDIASRNCLVDSNRRVKLADFGMTRATFENDYYKFTRKGMLPVRWMSPESLEHGIFTTYSDVWSYGVLLYEIITFGSFPYQGKSNVQVLELIKAGYTIEIPHGAKPQLEALIKSCWHQDSKRRPLASEIVEFIANNPKLLTPCLELPQSSVHLEGSDPTQLNIPTFASEPEKSSTDSKQSPTKPIVIPLEKITPLYRTSEDKSDSESVPMEQGCVTEPLLGSAKSSSSLLSLPKFVQRQQKKDDDDDDDSSGTPDQSKV